MWNRVPDYNYGHISPGNRIIQKKSEKTGAKTCTGY